MRLLFLLAACAGAKGPQIHLGDDTSAEQPAGDDTSTDDTSTDDTSSDDTSSDDTSTDDTAPPEPPADPAERGSLRWTSGSAEVTSDGERIPLTTFVPQGAQAAPVVVFSHGFLLGPDDYRSYGEHLASWGYAVVMPRYPGDAFSPRTHARLAGDLGVVLDWVEAQARQGGALGGGVDASRIAVAGHSMGGKISLLRAADDDRIDAAALLDPVDAGPPFTNDPSGYPSVTPERMGDLALPIALVGETTNASGSWTGQDCAPAADNFEQYYTHAVGPTLLVDVLGANHMSFLDDPNCGLPCWACPAGTDDPATTRRLAQGVMVAFLRVTLDAETDYGWWLWGEGAAQIEGSGLAAFERKGW